MTELRIGTSANTIDEGQISVLTQPFLKRLNLFDDLG
jgi:hypothetical protein